MQLLRRGGLKGLKMETKESVSEKIKALRNEVAKDKANKIADGKRAGAEDDKGNATRAGGGKTVQFWDVAEEFEAMEDASEDPRSGLRLA